MKIHAPEHFDGPDEKGKGFSSEAKDLVTTVRRVVLGLLDDELEIILGRGKNKKKFNLRRWRNHFLRKDKKHSSESLDSNWREEFAREYHADNPERQELIRKFRTPYSPNTRNITKNTIHQATDLLGIDQSKRIKTAIKKLGEMYQHISPERFFHRLKNGKLHDDVRFLFGIMYYMKSNPNPNTSVHTILTQGTAHLDKSYVDWRTLEIILNTAKKYFLYNEDQLQKELDVLRRRTRVSKGNDKYKAELQEKEKELKRLTANLGEYRKWLDGEGKDKKLGEFDGFSRELVELPLRGTPSPKIPTKSKKK